MRLYKVSKGSILSSCHQRASVSYQALLGELDLVLLLEVPRLSLAFETFVNQCQADRPAEWAANEGMHF